MYCTKCGKEIENDAAFCAYCGAPTKETNTGPSNQNTSYSANQNIVTTISQRLKTNGIIWIVVAALQILIGLCGAWFTLIVGATNLYSAIQDINYSKSFAANPVGIVEKVRPTTSAIITLVFNIIIGGVIGVAGSIYYFVAVRGFVLENEQAFLEIENQYTK